MNIESTGSFSYQRKPLVPARRTTEVALPFDNRERRMGHSTLRGADLLNHFWEMAQRMTRPDQVNLAASALASQVATNGVNAENRHFILGLPSRFNDQELKDVGEKFRSHPSWTGVPAAKVDAAWEQVKQLWNGQAPLQVQDQIQRRERPPLRSPDQIFFQTTLNPVSRKAGSDL